MLGVWTEGMSTLNDKWRITGGTVGGHLIDTNVLLALFDHSFNGWYYVPSTRNFNGISYSKFKGIDVILVVKCNIADR